MNRCTHVDVLLVGPNPKPGSYVGGIATLLMAQLARWELRASVAHFNTELWARDIGATGQCRLSHLAAFFINVIRLAWTLIRRRPSIIHFHSSIRLALLKDSLLALGARALGAGKVVFQIHFAMADAILLSRSLLFRRAQLRLIMLSCDRMLFLSRNVIAELAGMLPPKQAAVFEKKAWVLQNFSEIPDLVGLRMKDSLRVCIFFIGNVGHRKGAFDLVYATREIVERCRRPFRMVFAGPFDSPEVGRSLVCLVDELGVQELVKFLGPVFGSAKEEAFREADVFALPSYGEGVPIALIEAMSYGLPVVVSNVGGILETVENGREGIVLSPGDVGGLADALIHLIESPALRETMGLAGRSRVFEKYSPPAHFRTLRKVYASLGCLPALE